MSSDHSDALVSLPTSIPPENVTAREAFSQLTALAPPPHGAPCSHNATRGLGTCISSALSTIPSMNDKAKKIKANFSLLEAGLKVTLETNSAAESLSAIDGSKTRHPEWHVFASIGAKKQFHLLTSPDGHSKCSTYGQSNCSTPVAVN